MVAVGTWASARGGAGPFFVWGGYKKSHSNRAAGCLVDVASVGRSADVFSCLFLTCAAATALRKPRGQAEVRVCDFRQSARAVCRNRSVI